MKKRLFSLLLALVMLVGMIPATTLTAFAESGKFIEGIEGLGTPDNPYLIKDETQWDMIFGNDFYNVSASGFDGQYVKLCTDIVCTPYIYDDTHLDLNGHTRHEGICVMGNYGDCVVEVTGSGAANMGTMYGGTLILNDNVDFLEYLSLDEGTVILNSPSAEGVVRIDHGNSTLILKQGTVTDLSIRSSLNTDDLFYGDADVFMYGGRLEDNFFRETLYVEEARINLAFYGGVIAPDEVSQDKDKYYEDKEVEYIVTNTSYAFSKDGTTKKIASYDDFVDAIMSYGEFAVYAPYFVEQSIEFSDGVADLGTIKAASYPITFKGNNLPVSAYADGYRAYESIKVYNSNKKLVDECSNDTQNGEGLTYDLNRLPKGTYTIVEEVTLVDKNGQELLSEENKIIVNWKPEININGNISGVTGTTKTTVELYKSGSSTPMATTTVTGNGNFTFENVEEGSYIVKATADGYYTASKTFAITSDTVAVHPSLEMKKLTLNFSSLTPTPTSNELSAGFTDLGTANLGNAATNITFAGYPSTMPDGWTTGRSITVTRDGIQIYNKTYTSSEVFGWNLKDNISEGGKYVIKLKVFAQNGSQTLEKTHTYQINVKGSTIKAIALEGVGTPVIGKAPSTINTVKSNTDGVVVKKVIWNYWTSEMGGNWFVMPSGSKFEAGKRYAVEIELQTADGYSFTVNKSDMTVYINGEVAGKSINYSSNKFSAELEFESISTPAFTTQPVGGEAPYGGKYTVNWATNFTPVKTFLTTITPGLDGDMTELGTNVTSIELGAGYYQIGAYYNDKDFVLSDKFYVTEAVQTHTVTFKVDTTTVATKTVENGKTVTAPADPTQSGKTFLGWFSGSTKFDFTTPITGDITLTAKFEDATSNVKLGDVNGDDTIDYADIQCIYQHMSTDSKLTGDALIAADVNKDGAVDYGDIQRLYQHLSTDNKLS